MLPPCTIVLMIRPCFLVVDRELAGGISTRKLVIETAKFNVITAYSAAEALETLQQFPNVDGAIVDTTAYEVPCSQLIEQLKQLKPTLRIVAVGPRACSGADNQLESFDPGELLALLHKLEPEKAAVISKREQQLSEQ